MKIVDYAMIGAADPVILVEHAKSNIKLGFQPFGSPMFDGEYFCQAMVKYEEKIKTTCSGCNGK